MNYADMELEITIRGRSIEGDKFEQVFVFVQPEKMRELEKNDKGIIGDMLRRLE